MTSSFLFFFRRSCLLFPVWLLLALLFMPSPARAEGIDIEQVHLESGDDGYRLSATFGFDLNRGLEEAITHGVPLYFTTEVEIKRPRWYWFDTNTLSASQTIRISYNVLTRQYHAAIFGRLQQSFATLDDALSLVRRPSRWLVAERSALKPGETYNVAVRLQLDVAQLPKPFQVNALNNNDWRLSTSWKYFNFKAE